MVGEQRKSQYRKAVSLEYDRCKKTAPRIGVTGNDYLAEFIVATARRFGVPVVENNHLAAALEKLGEDREISPELYEAVAIVLNQIERTEAAKKKPQRLNQLNRR